MPLSWNRNFLNFWNYYNHSPQSDRLSFDFPFFSRSFSTFENILKSIWKPRKFYTTTVLSTFPKLMISAVSYFLFSPKYFLFLTNTFAHCLLIQGKNSYCCLRFTIVSDTHFTVEFLCLLPCSSGKECDVTMVFCYIYGLDTIYDQRPSKTVVSIVKLGRGF